MKNSDTFKKYAAFMLLSAAVVGSATFYFHVSDRKKNVETIIIDKRIEEVTETTIYENPKRTTVPKRSATTQKTTNQICHTTSVKTSAPVYLDINTADREELMKLEGIGEIIADEIIQYRSKNGRFNNIEEIMNIKGIGEKTFEAIKNNIYVENPLYEEATEPYTDISTETPTEDIPSLEEIAPIDLNSATAEELMLLPHVDEEIAQRIIEFREKGGGFSNEYELLLIEGLSRSEASEIIEYTKVK